MTKLEKIIAKVSAKPTPTTVKWVELKTLLEHLGYELLQTVDQDANLFMRLPKTSSVCMNPIPSQKSKPM